MLTHARVALMATFAASGIKVEAAIPDRLAPPQAYIQPAEEWASAGETYSQRMSVGLDVIFTVPLRSSNRLTLEDLEACLSAAIVALTEDADPEWVALITRVGTPHVLEVTSNVHVLAATMTVTMTPTH